MIFKNNIMKNIKRILVAIDNETSSEEVASGALQLVEQLHTEVALISVVETPAVINQADLPIPSYGFNENLTSEMEIEGILRNNYEGKHKYLIANIFFNHKVTTFIEEGAPYEAILRIAKEWNADLIVVGTNGRTGLEHLMIGSVAEKVIRHSEKPVFVIPIKK